MPRVAGKIKKLKERLVQMNKKRAKPKPKDKYEIIRRQRDRCMALIKKKCHSRYIVVLDLDGTTINYRYRPKNDPEESKKAAIRPTGDHRRIQPRPHLRDFLQKLSMAFNVVLFTAGNEGHLRYSIDKYFQGFVKAGFSSRWMHKGLKDMVPFVNVGKQVSFVDDDDRHYKFQSAKYLIHVSRWTIDQQCDNELLTVLRVLERKFPDRFNGRCVTPTPSDQSDAE